MIRCHNNNHHTHGNNLRDPNNHNIHANPAHPNPHNNYGSNHYDPRSHQGGHLSNISSRCVEYDHHNKHQVKSDHN